MALSPKQEALYQKLYKKYKDRTAKENEIFKDLQSKKGLSKNTSYSKSGHSKKESFKCSARVTKDKEGRKGVFGWMWSKFDGLTSFNVVQTKNSEEVHESATGKQWIRVMVFIKNHKSMSNSTASGLMNIHDNSVDIKEWNVGIKPQKKWCGKYSK